MSVRTWLRARAPQPPERLARRLDDVLGGGGDLTDDAASRECLEAAERLLGDLALRSSQGRNSALDLLVVDALVTYAFEASAETPDRLDAFAGDAMIRLARAAGA